MNRARVALLSFSWCSLLLACEGQRAVGVDPEALPRPTCEPQGLRADPIRYVGEDIRATYPSGGALLASAGQVLFCDRTTQHSNAATDLDLFAADAATGLISQLTRDDRDSLLLAAAGGAALYAEGELDRMAPARLWLRRADGQAVDLGSYASNRLYGAPGSLYGALRGRQLSPDGRAVAWAADDTLYLYENGERRAIAEALRLSGMPYEPPVVDRGVVAWSGWGERPDSTPGRIYRWQEGRGVEPLGRDDTEDRAPVIVGEQIIWTCGADICAWAAGRPTRVLVEGAARSEHGHCEAPVTDGRRAGWICDGAVYRYDPASDNVEIVTAATEQTNRSVLRISGALMAWIEIPQGADPYQGTATLVAVAGAHRLEVATVGLPCIMCGRYDPPLELSLDSDGDRGLLAWSYALREGDAPPRGAYAYTQVHLAGCD